MKKKLLFLCIFSAFTLLYTKVSAASLLFTEEERNKKDLANGLEFINASGFITNDNGVKTTQNINVVVKKNTNNLMQVVNWAKLGSNGKWVLSTVEDIAKDFELKNPGYTVMAAVNGDYFAYPPVSINASIHFDGDIIKPNNHVKYQSIAFDENSFEVIKQMTYGDYYLTIYDPETMKILAVEHISSINPMLLGDGQTAVYYNSSSKELSGVDKFIVEDPMGLNYNDAQLFAKGKISKYTTANIEVSNNEFAIITKDDNIIELLQQEPVVRVQKMISGVVNYDNVIGVDSQVLKDGVVRTFEEIKGQSVEHTTSRHPRTGIGFSENGDLILITVDGRQSDGKNGVVSSGIDLRELGAIMKSYGCSNAFNLDGGGSTQMVIRNSNDELVTINSPSEGPNFPKDDNRYQDDYRLVGNAVLIVVPDINVNTVYSEFASDSLTLDYNIESNSDVEIKDMILNINGEEQKIDKLSDSLKLNNLNRNGLNSFSFEFSYQKNGEIIKRAFSNKVIDLSTDSGIREPLEPTNFQVSFENVEDTNAFKVIITYEDSDNVINRISVIRKDNNQNITAYTEYAGCKIATIENAEIGKTYEFSIIYYYKLNKGFLKNKELEGNYIYTYNPSEENEGNNDNETDVNNDIGNDGLKKIIVPTVVGGLLVSFIGVMWFLKKNR